MKIRFLARPHLFWLGPLAAFLLVSCKKKDEPFTTSATPVTAPSPNCAQYTTDAKSKLGTLRSALSVYYADTEGLYPTNFSQLVPKYIGAIPSITLCNQSNFVIHGSTNAVSYVSSFTVTNTGGWGYGNSLFSVEWGHVFINSSDKSPEGTVWSSY